MPPDTFTFVPAAPGTWTLADREAASHEAWHAVTAVLLDVALHEVRIDRPDPGVLGHCVMVTHADRWRRAAVAIAPLVMSGTAPPEPDLLADDDDLRNASAYWLEAGEDRPTWPVLCDLVRGLLLSPAGKRAIRAVSGPLLAEGALPGDRVVQLVVRAIAHRRTT